MASSISSADVARLARGIRAGDRAVLSRAITLIESKRADHRRSRRSAHAGLLAGRPARRCASASPARPASASRRPSMRSAPCSPGRAARSRCWRSIRPRAAPADRSSADKTRMARLATDANAFIRPSPASGTLGGVAAQDARDHAAVRGRRLRRGAGRDRRRRPIGDRGRRHDRLFPRADAARAPATSCRD